MFRSLFIATLFLSLALPSLGHAQVCSSTDQDLMDSCVGDGIDTCQGTYSSCVRDVEEASDVYGRFLEKCCCSNGQPRTEEQFLACKKTVKSSYKAAIGFRSILNTAFKSKFYSQIKTSTFDDCNFGCDF